MYYATTKKGCALKVTINCPVVLLLNIPTAMSRNRSNGGVTEYKCEWQEQQHGQDEQGQYGSVNNVYPDVMIHGLP
jgi:hypothetical protein